jgi:hypothetical protein
MQINIIIRMRHFHLRLAFGTHKSRLRNKPSRVRQLA